MSKKSVTATELEAQRRQKAPKTIKLSTVIIGITWFASVVAALITGYFIAHNVEGVIRSEVRETVQEYSIVTSKE